MNSENDSQKHIDPIDALEVDEVSTIDDFIKELEEKEKDLHMTYDTTMVQLAESDVQNDELAELEKLLESYESNPSIHTSMPNHTEPAPNSEFLVLLENEVANLRNDLSKAERERAEMVESFKRRQSDFENFRKRIERERGDTHRNILSGLATQMLPVIDNLNRALDSAGGQEADKSSDFQQFIQGIVLVNHQLNDVLAGIGVSPILAVGEPFDPHFHEAVAAEPTDEYPPNMVVAELMRGYKIEGKVIRPAMVKVSSAAAPDPQNLLDLD